MKDPTSDADDRAPAQETLFFSAEMGPWTKLANAIVLMVLMLVAVCFVWMMSSLPRIEGRFPVKGLDLPATVARDEAGIPHVTARSVRDAYFAIGWTHAQDRLWQMELQRRVAAGRLAETVGAAGLDSDRFLRTLGIRTLAESGLDKLDKPTRDVLQAYADGINAWLRDHWHRLPPEYIILGIRPEPWSAADSLSIGRLMALQLTNDWRAELSRGKLAGRFDARRLGELWPDVATDAPVTLGAVDTDRVLAAVPDTASPRLASNVWAISGEHTASGKPLLANDPHLGFQAPVQWYLLSVDAPGLSLSGGTIPGIPFHLVGHNGRIAWGTTTTHADTVDLFVEKLAGEDSYLTPKGPERFAERTETIKVKGAADVELRVRTTRHGPVISDLSGGQVVSGQVIAMRATALAADDLTAQAYHRLNRAIDWRGFSGALRDFGAPVQNFAYADMTGAIGFATAGRVPTRPKGVNSAVPVRGWTAEGDWTGWIPADKMPQQLNPKSGRVVNANNAVVGNRYPYQIASQWPEAHRAERIEQVLAGHDGWTVAETAALQLDETSLPALTLKEELVSAPLSDPLAQQAARLIADWDGRMDRSRAEPLIFAAWLDQLWRDLLADELGDDFAAYGRPKADVVNNILNRNRHWCDDVSTTEAETCETVAGRALERAVRTLAERHGGNMMTWRWGDDHLARFDNAVMGRLPLVGDGMNLAIATGGDDFTVNRGSYLPGSFRHVHGPGLRAVFDLSDLNNSRFVIATGQSGNALSRHYDDMMAAWRDNLGRTLERRTIGGAVLRLEPGY
ncbi:penicillin acylase family protein [Magnetospirillum aberrantis]|uniref:Penicillin acylase family protein n=1 Tax=Magnetospirillum aberrantis SpK TaxID=908842 RepID=A0A7C9QTI4_9PROT|nr:penicillin acylase family protein [Magnetospirillum aberrantis SpK]